MLSIESANDQERFPPSMVNACSELQQAIISVMAKCSDSLILWSAKNGKSFEKPSYLQDTKLCGLWSARAANLPERFYADPTWLSSFLSAPSGWGTSETRGSDCGFGVRASHLGWVF